MPLLSLPFVQRPHAQPHLREVFTAKWVHDLRRDVEAILRSRHPPIPMLYGLMERSSPPLPVDEASWKAVWAELIRVADSGLDVARLLALGGQPVGHHGSEAWVEKARRHLESLREKVPG